MCRNFVGLLPSAAGLQHSAGCRATLCPADHCAPPASAACSYTLALSAGAVATALFVGGFVVKSLQED